MMQFVLSEVDDGLKGVYGGGGGGGGVVGCEVCEVECNKGKFEIYTFPEVYTVL